MQNRVFKTSLIAPALLLLLSLNVFPLLYSIGLSLTDARMGAAEMNYVGLANYERVFDQPKYAGALRNTAWFVVLAVGIELVLGFVLALSIKKAFVGKPLVLTLLLIPMMLSPAVMGLFWHQLLNGTYGLLNQLLALVNITGPNWITDRDVRFYSIVMIDVWMWTPFMMLIALAGLNAIPNYLYEAAEIDRARPWTVFRRITLPMCAPLLGLAVLLRATDALKQFDLVMAITGPTTPDTQTVSVMIFQDAIRSQNLGLGAAYSVVVLVVVIAIATVFTRYLDHMQKGRAA